MTVYTIITIHIVKASKAMLTLIFQINFVVENGSKPKQIEAVEWGKATESETQSIYFTGGR